MVSPTLMIWDRVLTVSAVTVRESIVKIVWVGELVAGGSVVGVDGRGEYVRDASDLDAESLVELIDLVLGCSSSLVGRSVKRGAGSSSGDVQLVAELVAMDAGDEAYVVLMDWVDSDVDPPFGCSCV
jgi:hypothetical protein